MRQHCQMFKDGIDHEGNFCRFPPTCACSHLQEQAQLAYVDAKLVAEMAAKLRAVNFEIEACGGDGKVEREKVRELAPRVLKAMANYI